MQTPTLVELILSFLCISFMTDIGDNWIIDDVKERSTPSYFVPTSRKVAKVAQKYSKVSFWFPPQFTFPFGLIKHGPDVANCCDLEQSLIYNTTRCGNRTFELKQRFLITLKINDDYCKLIEF